MYKRMGQCAKCGDCCNPDLLEGRIQAFKEAEIPCKLVNNDCDKWDPETGLCTDYENRPEICRIFPRHPIDLIGLPRCGYYFVEDSPSPPLY